MENLTSTFTSINDSSEPVYFSKHGGLLCQDGWLSSFMPEGGNAFLWTWMGMSLASLLIAFMLSGTLFYFYYWHSNITYEKWQHKSHPQYPSAEKVRDEIVQMCKAFVCSTFCPALSVYLASMDKTKAYCGPAPSRWYHVAEFVGVLLVSDFFEFYYHYCGHSYKALWQQHKHHHKFFNPSPFSVIADEFADQFVRASPLLLFPLVVPINMDLMFLQFGTFFYLYGVYLHWGYELEYPDAHHPVFNTAFQHYCHHAKGIIGKPTNCGFFFKIWDKLFQSDYQGECFCAKCERKKGNRSREAFEQIVIPDYSQLLQPSFWFQAKVWTGATSVDANDSVGKEESPSTNKPKND